MSAPLLLSSFSCCRLFQFIARLCYISPSFLLSFGCQSAAKESHKSVSAHPLNAQSQRGDGVGSDFNGKIIYSSVLRGRWGRISLTPKPLPGVRTQPVSSFFEPFSPSTFSEVVHFYPPTHRSDLPLVRSRLVALGRRPSMTEARPPGSFAPRIHSRFRI